VPFVAMAGAALIIAAIVVMVVVLVVYNAVVALEKRVDRAWANVDVALRQRHDELPNLVEAVRDVMAFERDVLERVTRLRAAVNAFAPNEPLPRRAANADDTSEAVRSLLAVVERYPALRSQQNVAALQAEIERLETLVATRREVFNDAVFRYNATIRQVPAVLLADVLGWRSRAFFRAEPGDEARPEAAID
jgi:LemA protein